MSAIFSMLGILLAVVLVLVIYVIKVYNHLITLKNRFTNAFAQIDVQLQRRYDLIPNMVETAKGYMKHEREVLENVVKARNMAASAEADASKNPADASKMESLMKAEAGLTASMGKFFALAENYPDLKANQTMQQLMEELSTTENKISFARQAYNDAVMTYNTYRTQFPPNIIAGMFMFKGATYFEIEDEQVKEPVKVSFT